MRKLKATILDDDHFRLLAFPFSGPLPSPRWPGGVDLDGETFTPRTDIKADWLTYRPVDWHHGNDPTGVTDRNTIIGKAVDPVTEDDGIWVDVWLKHGERRLALIKELAARGGQIFGSSEPLQEGVKINKATGEILVWPYLRQTLSTSPQNTHSILRAVKGVLDDGFLAGYPLTDAFWSDLTDALHDLGTDLRDGAMSGRVEPKALAEVLDDTGTQVERFTALVSSRASTEDSPSGHPNGRDA